ncbi:MAG: AGE family epimerase/isomerase [Terriglobia bacterium]
MDHSKIHNYFRSLLLDGFLPFWLNHGIDWEHGGVLSCMAEDGSPVSGDKFMWSQARSVWTFSALYNRIEKRPELLKVAENSVRFLLAHGRDDRGRWVYHTDRVGNVIEGALSIYTDCFVVYGFSEYYRAVQNPMILEVALSTFDRVRRRIEEPDFQETAPYPLPMGWKNHGVPMIMTEVAGELARTTGSNDFAALADTYAARIMSHFVRPHRKLLLEFLTDDYKELPPPAGTFVMPGHAIESMWFMLHRARQRGDQALMCQAAEVIRWHLEAGWDKEYGGILLGVDAEGHEPYLPHAEKKLWWPHTEALYALLLAHELTGEAWCAEWYDRVEEWSLAHFPMAGVGEWRQRLSREGQPVAGVIALPVKDPFHLPRAATLIVQLLEQ